MEVQVNLEYLCQLLSNIFLYICIAAHATCVRDWWSHCGVGRAGLKDEPAGQLPRVLTYKGCWDVTGIIGNMVPVKSGFHTWKNFSENYPHFGHVPLNMFARHVLGQKVLKNVSSKGCKIISLPRVPVCLKLALSVDSAVTAQCEMWVVEF
jgi:hypothetical protein